MCVQGRAMSSGACSLTISEIEHQLQCSAGNGAGRPKGQGAWVNHLTKRGKPKEHEIEAKLEQGREAAGARPSPKLHTGISLEAGHYNPKQRVVSPAQELTNVPPEDRQVHTPDLLQHRGYHSSEAATG